MGDRSKMEVQGTIHLNMSFMLEPIIQPKNPNWLFIQSTKKYMEEKRDEKKK